MGRMEGKGSMGTKREEREEKREERVCLLHRDTRKSVSAERENALLKPPNKPI